MLESIFPYLLGFWMASPVSPTSLTMFGRKVLKTVAVSSSFFITLLLSISVIFWVDVALSDRKDFYCFPKRFVMSNIFYI